MFSFYISILQIQIKSFDYCHPSVFKERLSLVMLRAGGLSGMGQLAGQIEMFHSYKLNFYFTT